MYQHRGSRLRSARQAVCADNSITNPSAYPCQAREGRKLWLPYWNKQASPQPAFASADVAREPTKASILSKHTTPGCILASWRAPLRQRFTSTSTGSIQTQDHAGATATDRTQPAGSGWGQPSPDRSCSVPRPAGSHNTARMGMCYHPLYSWGLDGLIIPKPPICDCLG